MLARHLLVVANETLEAEDLVDAVERLVAPVGDVLIVCPVLVGGARHWTSDLSAGILRAHERLLSSLDSLRRLGITCEGVVGDGHPLLAIEDALRALLRSHLDRHALALPLRLARAAARRTRPRPLRTAGLARRG